MKKKRTVTKTPDAYEKRRKKEREEKKKEEDVAKFRSQGFEIVPRGTNFSFISPTDRRNAYIRLGRRSTLKNVVEAIFPIDAFNSLALDDNFTYDTFLTYLGLRMFFTVQKKETETKDPFKSTYCKMRPDLLKSFDHKKVWNENTFAEAIRKFIIPREQMRTTFSYGLARLLVHGEFVVLDEKQHRFTGASPTIRKNPNKPHPIGHMMSQLTVLLDTNSLPFCFGFFPYDKDKFLDNTSHSGEEMAQWVVELIGRAALQGKPPVIVADSLYNTYAARDLYEAKRMKYIMAVKSRWWGGVCAFFEDSLEAQGDTAYAWSERDKRVVCHHWDRNASLGKKYVVSNAFTLDRKTKFNPAVPPVYFEYGITFNACDNFNMVMNRAWFPYRVKGYREHWSMMFYSMMFMNVVHLGKHLELIEPDEKFETAILKFAAALLE